MQAKPLGRRGSAIVLAVLLLVLLNAIGMYVMSLPVSMGESSRQHYLASVARNMARAGAHAAIARLPAVSPEAAPYVRRIPVGSEITGMYSVASRGTGDATGAARSGKGSPVAEYELVSEGSVPGSFGGSFRVRANVRVGPVPGRPARILKWEETALEKPSPGADR
jgi:hypothetical protein